MKYTDTNRNISPEYVNTFRIYPSEGELVIDFAQIDYAATRIIADAEGREKPDEIVMGTKARLSMPPQLVLQLHKALTDMLPKKKEDE